MIVYKDGDIFESNCHVLVNPVNCEGVMGAGLAKEFKNRFPKMFVSYKLACDEGSLMPGGYHFYESSAPWDHAVLNLPTKNLWKNPSTYDIVRSSLEVFVSDYKLLNIHSAAFPALGCGLGGLDWNNVQQMMEKYLKPLDILVEIYPPK